MFFFNICMQIMSFDEYERSKYWHIHFEKEEKYKKM